MKVILNKCFGGFDVSDEAYKLYAKRKGLELFKYKSNLDFKNPLYTKLDSDEQDIFSSFFTKDFGDKARISNEEFKKHHLYLRGESRYDETLIEIVEELGEKASGRFGDLQVIEIPDNSFFEIDEYDGVETIYYSESEINIK